MNLEQNFPQVSGPFLDANGQVTQEWQAFFRALWNRTGGALGSSTDDALIAALLALASGDAGDPTARAAALAAELLAVARTTPRPDDTQAKLFALAQDRGQQRADQFAQLLALVQGHPRFDDTDARLFALAMTRNRGPISPKLPVYVVANLPTAPKAGQGALAFVTDATATLAAGIGTNVAGGGANKTPVYSDGTNWIIG